MQTRLLRHARHLAAPLEENTAHAFAARHALVHYPSGAIYSFIPRNGCTTLRYSLALANGCIRGPEDFPWIHHNDSTFAASLRELVTAPHAFVVLRCPYRRLASVFLDKFVTRRPDFWEFRRLTRDAFEPGALTFRDFVAWLGHDGFLRANPHWRPQVDFLVFEDYDDWFRVEDFAGLTARLAERLGFAVHDARPMAQHDVGRFELDEEEGFADTPLHVIAEMQLGGRSPGHRALYDAELAARVRALYAEDFGLYLERFGGEALMFPEITERMEEPGR